MQTSLNPTLFTLHTLRRLLFAALLLSTSAMRVEAAEFSHEAANDLRIRIYLAYINNQLVVDAPISIGLATATHISGSIVDYELFPESDYDPRIDTDGYSPSIPSVDMTYGDARRRGIGPRSARQSDGGLYDGNFRHVRARTGGIVDDDGNTISNEPGSLNGQPRNSGNYGFAFRATDDSTTSDTILFDLPVDELRFSPEASHASDRYLGAKPFTYHVGQIGAA